jgi:Raf kinase inhibitor-like YbhB/YbcL family protein
MQRRTPPLSFGAAFVSIVAGCNTPSGPGPSAPSGGATASITVTSKSFSTGGEIPVDFTCDGKDTSPQLTWSAPPEKTKALVLVVDDADAASGPFTHWIVMNLPGDALRLDEGVDPTTLGAKIGLNDFHNVRWNGPCPPRGEMHRYQFHLYAIDAPLTLREGVERADVDAALSEHVLGAGTLVAAFSH